MKAKDNLSLINMQMGMLPPQNIECEESLLGCMLQFAQKPDIQNLISIMQDEFFYKDAHQLIFQAIKELMGENKPIDLVTVVSRLRKNEIMENVGGPYYLTRLTSRVTSSMHTQEYCVIIVQEYTRREIIRISSELTRDAYKHATDEAKLIKESLSKIEQKHDQISEVIRQLMNQTDSGLQFALQQEVINIESDLNKGVVPGISFGLKSLDKDNGKMQPGDLIIIAARPSMGKSILACGIAVYNAIVGNLPVDLYSLEMPMARLLHRIINMATGISSEKIASRNLSKNEMQLIKKCIERYNNNLHIHTISGDSIRDKISVDVINRNLRMRKPKLAIIDYLQLMESSTGKSSFSREQEVANISRGLKRAAMNHNIPIIALSQLSREVEKRDKTMNRPKLSDLRESGSIEQDADNVMFLYRPAYYGFSADGFAENATEVISEKNRNGTKATTMLSFNTTNLTFEDYQKELEFETSMDSSEDPPF